ncbi:MAG: aldo/keto reductase [Fusobacteriaceae bacterium]|nr:aldo/keto reductase [Fusobacteriaceae bacterium]MBP6467692.1 aldo/keto reductase [Fusobacteriaceae bacterium]MBP9596046.1 aldo/keto reductase [Fusobacteriaceae bacterium]MBU9918216.1 aldo/keto reductase [Fusobacteriaceae bacterium]
MKYRRLGNSGIKLPLISFGLWNNFGKDNDYDNCKNLIWECFDSGITHFDLANNYGPDPGNAEKVFGQILKDGLMEYRDELIISTKAGYTMWAGPYGDMGSRKYLIASLNQSLKRMGLDYVDIFYHHRPDTETDIRETMIALYDIVRSGKALYVGLSNYTSELLKIAVPILKELNVPYIITQPKYSMLERKIEKDDLLNTQNELGGGTICFSVLAQGMLSEKYIDGIPEDSRAMKKEIVFLKPENITQELRNNLKKLKEIAELREQSLSQMAIAWALRDEKMTSVLIGASKVTQIRENLKALENLNFSKEELEKIDEILR